jgi:hypothetical protein
MVRKIKIFVLRKLKTYYAEKWREYRVKIEDCWLECDFVSADRYCKLARKCIDKYSKVVTKLLQETAQ